MDTLPLQQAIDFIPAMLIAAAAKELYLQQGGVLGMLLQTQAAGASPQHAQHPLQPGADVAAFYAGLPPRQQAWVLLEMLLQEDVGVRLELYAAAAAGM